MKRTQVSRARGTVVRTVKYLCSDKIRNQNISHKKPAIKNRYLPQKSKQILLPHKKSFFFFKKYILIFPARIPAGYDISIPDGELF